MKTEEFEKALLELYNSFMEEVGVDSSTGMTSNQSMRFSGLPFLGEKYHAAEKRILFVGLDIGSDEGTHDFTSKRKEVSPIAKNWKQLPAHKAFNPHYYGIYVMTLRILKKYYEGLEDLWEKISKDKTRTAGEIISKFHAELPIDLVDYVAQTNVHKFVTAGRKNKGGDQDRQWNKDVSRDNELRLLEKEIKILKPNYIFFQGDDFWEIEKDLNIDLNIATVKMHHPSSRKRSYKNIEYIDKIASIIEKKTCGDI